MSSKNKRFDAVKFNKPFHSRLRKLYESTGEKQEILAEKLGVTRQTVNDYTQGYSKPDIESIVKIAQHFNVSTDWLLGMPNASKEINADKYQVMKTTGLSEKAVDHLIIASAEHPQAVNSLLSVDDFTTAMSDLDEAIHLSQNWSCDSFYLIPAYTEHPTMNDIGNDIQRRSDAFPMIIQINEIVRYLISYAFEEMEVQVKKEILRNIYSIMAEDWETQLSEMNAEKDGAKNDGNDNPTKE